MSADDEDRCPNCIAGMMNLYEWEWYRRPFWVRCFACDGTGSKREGARRMWLRITNA